MSCYEENRERMQLDMVHCGGADLLDICITHNLHFAHMYANKNEGQFEVWAWYTSTRLYS